MKPGNMVMKNKKKNIKKAVALRYKPPKQTTPTIAAKGSGKVAEKIIAIAKENDIPIREDTDLIETLSQLDVDQEVPPELYRVVAEVLAWVYQVNANENF